MKRHDIMLASMAAAYGFAALLGGYPGHAVMLAGIAMSIIVLAAIDKRIG